MSEPAEGKPSDREWRQKRRTMAKLEFDPVPETPPLLPRSLYTETPGKSQQQVESGAHVVEISREVGALEHSRTLPKGILKVGAAMAFAPSDELPSTSSALSLRAAPFAGSTLHSSDRASAQASTSNISQEFDTGHPPLLAELNEHMAVAHEAVRQSVLSAVADLQTRLTKERVMERLQLTAAHSTAVTILQSKIDELKDRIAKDSELREAQERLLDRFSAFTAERRERESIAACFRAWQAAVVRAKGKRHADQLAARHHTKKMLLPAFRGWARTAQQQAIVAQVEQLQTQHERRVVQVAQEYQLKVEQLQRELEEATREVAGLKKCRLQLEEDLRQVFLRGVSSMNIEALQVFGSRRQDQEAGPSDDTSAVDAPTAHSDSGKADARSSVESEYPGTLSAENEHAMPVPMAPPVPRSSDTIHNLDNNLQRLLQLSSKLSNSSVSTAHFERTDATGQQQPAPRYAGGPSGPRVQTWARARSFSSSTAVPATSSISGAKLRSAEMVQQQQLAMLAMQGRQVSPSTNAVIAYPAQMLDPQPSLSGSRYQSQSAAKLQVEMELLRAEFAAAASKASVRRPSMPLTGRWK